VQVVRIVEQDAARRGVDIVELAGADGPRKRGDGAGGADEREAEDQEHHGHRKALERSELASTVSELSGIAAAAMSGWTRPVTASVPAMRL
jgi:hypothetical protein